MHGRILQAVTVVITFALLITGCTSEAFNIGMAKDKENNVVDTGFSVSTVGSYDSADTAVVMSVDQENSCVVFMNMDAGRQYTLYYDGTTYVTDKYDGPMTISQLRAGDVVDVNFLKGKRQLASIKQSPSAWVYENIDNYDLGGINKTANIGSSTYYLPDEAVILSEGKRVEVMDVVAQDRVTIRGVDREIYSVNVEQGHGYLRLRNEQALIGGWIEVGNTVIREITEDMLLVVPEGSYQVALSNEGASSVKDVVIERDRETVLDVGDIEIIKDKTGKILFSVSPAGTEVTIDGNVTDISSAVELPYGIHQVHMEAEGYDSLTKYIQVGSEYAKISFELEKKKEEETPSVSENTLEQETEKSEIPELEYAPVKDPEPSVSENSISENTLNASKNNKVYIDAPKDVEVYVDSNYVGIAPISFKKSTGSHTVTLRKAGYKTRSYTIYLYNDGEDVTYSFTELEKEQSDTISGNDVNKGDNNRYTISFHANGGKLNGTDTVITDASGKLNVLPDATKEGFTFIGWFTEGGDQITTDYKFDRDIIVYAQWKEIPGSTYTITFDANGGKLNGTDTFTTDASGKLNVLPDATREGFTLIGWFTEAEGGNKITTDHKFDRNTTVYAHWEEIPDSTYTITFDANDGGLNGINTFTTDANGELDSFPDVVREGFIFIGWFTEGGDQITTGHKFDQDITVYAHWEEKKEEDIPSVSDNTTNIT